MLKLAYMQETKRLKICFIITKGFWGGASSYIYQIAKNLDQNMFDIYLISGKGEQLPLKMKEFNVKTFQIEKMERDINILSEIKSFFLMYKIIKSIKPDIIHLNSPKASLIGSIVGRLLNVPKIITTVHGFTFNEKRSFIQTKLIKFLSWIFILFSDKTIVINKYDLKQSKMLCVKDKIVYIPNGIDTETIFNSKENARETILSLNQNINKDLFWIGTVAELHKNKGLIYGLKAITKIEKINWIIFGDGQEKQNLQKYIKENNLQNKVFLLGYKDIKEVVKGFDLFLLPSIKEGLPYVLLEAGLAQIPIISSDAGGIPDLIENNKTGMVFEKEKIDQIQKAIKEAILNKEESQKMSLNLYQKIIRDFSLKDQVQKTVEIYKSR